MLPRVTIFNTLLGVAALRSLLLLMSSVACGETSFDTGAGIAGTLGLLSVAATIYWHTYDLYKHSYLGLGHSSGLSGQYLALGNSGSDPFSARQKQVRAQLSLIVNC
jgi:hypothetical protein